MVIIMGVQYYEGKEHRYDNYSVLDVLKMMGRACRPTEDERSRCVLMCQQTRKEFYKKSLAEGWSTRSVSRLVCTSRLPPSLLYSLPFRG